MKFFALWPVSIFPTPQPLTTIIQFCAYVSFTYLDFTFKWDSAVFFHVRHISPMFSQASQVALVVKNPSANAGDIRDMGLIPGLRRSPGGGHSNPLPVFLPGESPRTEESGGLQSIRSQRVSHDWSDLALMHNVLTVPSWNNASQPLLHYSTWTWKTVLLLHTQ